MYSKKVEMDFSLMRDALDQGLIKMNLTFSSEQKEQLLFHIKLLEKWNSIYNLTSEKSLKEVITTHILDSLSLHNYLIGNFFLDIGSGAGFPGLPLAIAEPKLQFVLLESKKKKTQFLKQVQLELGLKNLEIICSRAEDFRPEAAFDGIMARAVGAVEYIVNSTQHLIGKEGRWYIMVGELTLPLTNWLINKKGKTISLNVPGKYKRHLLIINNKDESGLNN